MNKLIKQTRIEGNIAYVPLTKGMFALIDSNMVHLVEGFNWFAKSNGYAVRTSPSINGKRKAILMHRVMVDAPEEMVVDHINGNKIDNRLANIRICTQSQNTSNRGAQSNNTSGFKGITAERRGWKAQITVNSRTIYLGNRSTKEEARALYIEAAKKYHGEFARY